MAFLATLNSLSLTKKAIALASVIAVIVGFSFLIKMAARPPLSLLYAGIDAAAAGEIVARLDAEGVKYKVDGERIYVEAPARDRLRLTLARDGLPRQSIAGYELLDGMSGFSTTSEMFSATYWRAKEGELARTILAMPGVTAARVHIGADERSPFSRTQTPRTASVTITAPNGLSDAQVKAIQHITALSVSDLQPEKVAVADTRLGLLTATKNDPLTANSMDEERRAKAMERNLLQLLEAHVGRGAARVSVSLAINRQKEEVSQAVVDPNTAVATNRTRTERKEKEKGRNGAVTIASDLPEGDKASDDRSSELTETKEEVEYAVTRTDRRIEKYPGEIERLTVAVLLDNIPAAEDGEASTPRTPEEIEAIRALIENAVGFDPDRGDRVTIQNLAFDTPPIPEDMVTPDMTKMDRLAPNLWQLAQLGLVSVVTLILGLFVVKPILKPTGAIAAIPGMDGGNAALAGDPLALLRATASDAPEEAAALLSSWLEEEDPQ
ncbi:MAG: flagellar basal-body MS-ring/collar protein FliF [Parvularcula sp.]